MRTFELTFSSIPRSESQKLNDVLVLGRVLHGTLRRRGSGKGTGYAEAERVDYRQGVEAQ